MMEKPDNLKAVFRATGFRWTPQRQVIAEALWGSTKHPTVDEIYGNVLRRHPGMSRATVYNTMEALAGVGQIEVIHAPDGTRRYDPNPRPHHHLRCRDCGRIIDLPLHQLPVLPRLSPSLSHGFRLVGYRIELQGICPRCSTGPAGTRSGATGKTAADRLRKRKRPSEEERRWQRG